MHVARERLDVLHRRGRQDTVTEVEDVSGPAAGAREDLVGRGKHALERPQQQRRVEISLDTAIGADALPRFVQRRAPVGADHVAAGLAQQIENRAGAHAKMNRRHAGRRDAREDFRGVRQDELAVVGRIQRTDPRVEYLHAVDPRFDLRNQVIADDLRDEVAETMPRSGVAVHERLRVSEVVRVAAFDGVRGERERRTGESNQRHAVSQRRLDLSNRVQNVAELLTRLEPADTSEVRLGPQWALDCRSFALYEVERNAHRLEREQQVRKQDGSVDVDPTHRLERDFGREIGRSTEIEQGIALA